MKIATAAYPLDVLTSWAQYEDKLAGWVATAAASGAELLVFPEYGAMELINPGALVDLVGAALRAVATIAQNTFLVILTMIFILFEATGFTKKLRIFPIFSKMVPTILSKIN